MIQAKRLTLRMASDEEMQQLIEKETDAGLKQAYGEMLAASKENPGLRQWYAAWFMELEGERIGDLCFKGLNADGMVEIGYGLLPDFEGKGYATEAVQAMTEWALQQPGVLRLEAETEPGNRASQRVLEKAGFAPTGAIGEEGPRFEFRGTNIRKL